MFDYCCKTFLSRICLLWEVLDADSRKEKVISRDFVRCGGEVHPGHKSHVAQEPRIFFFFLGVLGP